jgi:hypothetical protein
MLRTLVRKGLSFSADYQYFDEINAGLPRDERTYGSKSAYYTGQFVPVYNVGVGFDYYY